MLRVKPPAATFVRLLLCSVFCAAPAVVFGQETPVIIPDTANPWYPDRNLPALRTPEWIGEENVDAVFVLAIDDMRDPAKYETYLRPILNRLKQIDGRAPVSIMTCDVKPNDPQLQSWLAEGLSIECHTVDHPCPLLNAGDLPKAKSTYDRCVDQIHRIPGNIPVAFRTPCCDSLNTVSPRFFSEVFSQKTDSGKFLQLDSSVFLFYTSDDPSIPRELTVDADGRDRFLKYLPRANRYRDLVHDNFVNYIRDYPYPYVIDNTCWEIPCIAPSDWSAQHFHGVNNPQTIEDWKAAIDITVLKQGCFSLVFHPHGWIRAEQVVEMIDHAVAKHGSRIRFMTFREVADRLNTNLTGGRPLRSAGAEVARHLSHVTHRASEIAQQISSAELVPHLKGREEPIRMARMIPPTATDDQTAVIGTASSTEIWHRSRRRDGKWRGPVSTYGGRLPTIRRADGTHSGFFIHDGYLCLQNEDTDSRPDLIERISIARLVAEHDRARERQSLGPIPVGAAIVEITPEYPVRLTGYGNRLTESEGVAAEIHARALAIGGTLPAAVDAKHAARAGNEPETPLSVLVTVDNCGVPHSVTEAVYEQVARKHGIPRSRFALSSTHTHSGPWLPDFAPQIMTDVPEEQMARLRRYQTELVARLAEVVLQAVEHRRPGRLSMGRGSAGFAINRRVLSNGQWTGFGETPDGPTDHQLPVLAAHDTDGHLIAVLTSYACHATTETGTFNLISGDWPGFAADMIEERVPGAVALIAIGTGADANPSPRGLHEQAKQHGKTVADEVLRLLELPAASANLPASSEKTAAGKSASLLQPVSPRIVCRMDRIDLPLAPLPSEEEWRQKATQPGAPGAHARRFLRMLEQGQPIPTVIPDYPVQTWCFGDDLAMVFLGGEVVVDYSIRMNEMFDSNRLWINSYSNDVPCYIASRRLLREGGYEVDSSMLYYDRPNRLAPETEDLICDTVQRLLPHEFYAESLSAKFPGPKSPAESMACMSARPGFRVELVAAEPLIHDPVAFDWDPQGRLWVVEMGDYPNGEDAQAAEDSTGGRIRILEDTNQDGTYDHAVTFLDHLGFPNGISCWRNGVIVTAAPDVFYAEDTDGDGRADVRQTLFTGFAEGNQQHRVNGLRWGLDGWLVLANGDSGGTIQPVSDQSPDAVTPVSIRGRDLKIHPDTRRLQTLSGQTQFGRERDDFGNWFGNNNSNPIWQYVLDEHYLQRNPHASVSTARAQVAEIPGAAPVFPTSTTLARFNDFGSANRFTSACSTMIYRDVLAGESFYGNAFTSEPVHNLVSRLVLNRTGVEYHGSRAEDEQQSEFLASTDNWFRPTMIRTGPDGGLYVADMYRQVIEHPEWIPPEYQRKMNLRAGNDRGRIYRIVPAEGCCDRSRISDLRAWFSEPTDQIPVEELVERMASPNGWWRDTAQRLLLHRRDTTACERLQFLAGSHPSEAVRVQALHTLLSLFSMGLESPPAATEPAVSVLQKALLDPSPHVRRNAIQLLEPFIAGSDPEIRRSLQLLVQDPDEAVVLQLAFSAGEMHAAEAAPLLARILSLHRNNSWIVSAVFSSLNAENIAGILREWMNLDGQVSQASVELFGRLIGQAAAFNQPDSVRAPLLKLLTSLTDDTTAGDASAWRAAIETIGRIRRHGEMESAVRESADINSAMTAAVDAALKVAVRHDAPEDLRAACIGFAVADQQLKQAQLDRLLSLLNLQTPAAVQQAVVIALGSSGRSETASLLLNRWRSFGPALKAAVLDTLLRDQKWTSQLLDALADGAVSTVDLDAVRRDQLLTHRVAEIRNRAATLLSAEQSSTRAEVIADWRGRLEGLSGDLNAGKTAFEKRCAACHRLQGVGRSIGADLEALKDRSTDALLTAIMDPNRAVESKFLSYTAVTKNGLAVSGMLLSETANNLTLISADGKEHAVPRDDLEELIASNRSLMPEGLERDLSPQELADIISLVQTSGIPWKRFDGNQPQVVRADADGVITLPASAAEIYGPRLEFEGRHENLGWWASTDDFAAWTFEAQRSGHYTVELEYACDNGTAGNLIRLSTGTRLLTARVPGTGTWEDYSRWNAGTLDVHGGRGRLTVTAAESPSSHLIDLRAIRLIPPR